MRSWILFAVLVLACFGARADFYRWVDAEGKVSYSDQPPPPHIKKVEKIKASGGKPGEVALPYSLQQAVNNFPVTLFATECGEPCTHARELLAKRGIPYAEMDATVQAAQEQLKKLTGGPLEVPVLQVGRDTLRGFEESSWNSSLDAAGYPQTAVIAPRPPNKPSKPADIGTPAAQAPASAPAESPASTVPPTERSQ
jgi:glutaredoxin